MNIAADILPASPVGGARRRAVVIAAGATAGSMISVAQASPELPLRTPAQLLAAVAGPDRPAARVHRHRGGNRVAGHSRSCPVPATRTPSRRCWPGSHTLKVWYADPPTSGSPCRCTLSETDLIRNGRQAWVWQSSLEQRDQDQLPAKADGTVAPTPRRPISRSPRSRRRSQVLAAVGPSTTVSVQRTVTVAGPGRLPAGAGAQGQRLAGRPGDASRSTRPRTSRCGSRCSPRARHARLPGRLHLDLLRRAGRGQLRLHRPRGRQGQDGHPAVHGRPAPGHVPPWASSLR